MVFLRGDLSDFTFNAKAHLGFWVKVADEQPDHALLQVIGDKGLPVSDQIVDLPHRFADAFLELAERLVLSAASQFT